jgi:hypothetical protein
MRRLERLVVQGFNWPVSVSLVVRGRVISSGKLQIVE